MMSRTPLPIDDYVTHIAEAVSRHQQVVVSALPGSGKTTRLPAALYQHQQTHYAAGNKVKQPIWVVLPRRLAVKSAAMRVAEECGFKLGQEVGYQVRFEAHKSEQTGLLFMTSGLFFRMLMGNPSLCGVGTIILDEFHERGAQMDVALAYMLALQRTGQAQFKLLLMSATLEHQSLLHALKEAMFIEVPHRPYPVSVSYHPYQESWPQERALCDAVVRMVNQQLLKPSPEHTAAGNMPSGRAILVFLPGMAEIRRVESALMLQLKDRADIHVLHSQIAPEQQARALVKSQQIRIILATNIAETSLTIEGVDTVIDSGLERQLYENPFNGFSHLKLQPISQASAAQRAGRAGRLAKGVACRLYSEADFRARRAFMLPEIKRIDLSEMLLNMAFLAHAAQQADVQEMADFTCWPFIDQPPAPALEAATQLLIHLEAWLPAEKTTLVSRLTPLGMRMAQWPMPPRLSRILIEAERLNVLLPALMLVTYLSTEMTMPVSVLDVLHEGIITEEIKQVYWQFAAYFNVRTPPQHYHLDEATHACLARACLSGFVDRVAKRGKEGATASLQEWVFCGGGSALLTKTDDTAFSDYIVVLDAEMKMDARAHTYTRVCAYVPIQVDWLLAHEAMITETTVYRRHATQQALHAYQQLKYAALVLDEQRVPIPLDMRACVWLEEWLGVDEQEIENIEVGFLLQKIAQVADKEPLETLLVRIKYLAAHWQSLGTPGKAMPNHTYCHAPQAPFLGRALLAAIKECLQYDEHFALPGGFANAVFLQMVFQQMTNITYDTCAIWLPLQVKLAKRTVKIHYTFDGPVFIEAPIQEFFSLSEGPRILAGRLPVTLHLLAPNRRAIQVTQDLAGFWQRTYREMRTQLMRRYPKHAFPEDPLDTKPHS